MNLKALVKKILPLTLASSLLATPVSAERNLSLLLRGGYSQPTGQEINSVYGGSGLYGVEVAFTNEKGDVELRLGGSRSFRIGNSSSDLERGITHEETSNRYNTLTQTSIDASVIFNGARNNTQPFIYGGFGLNNNTLQEQIIQEETARGIFTGSAHSETRNTSVNFFGFHFIFGAEKPYKNMSVFVELRGRTGKVEDAEDSSIDASRAEITGGIRF